MPDSRDSKSSDESREVSFRKRPRRFRKSVFVVIATVLGIGLLAGLDRGLGVFLKPVPRSLLFPSDSQITHESCEFSVSVTTSSAGIRDREFQLGSPTPETFRIAAIGDSFTFGWGVEKEEAWPKILERELNRLVHDTETRIEVLNFGYPGASPSDYESAAISAIQHFQPQIILIGTLQGDDLIQLHSHEDKQTPKTWRDTVGTVFPTTSRLLSPPPERSSMQSYREVFLLSNQYIRSQLTRKQRQRYETLNTDVRQAFESGLLNPSLVQTAITRPQYFSEPLNADADWRSAVTTRYEGILKRIRQRYAGLDCALIVAIVPDGPYVSRSAWNGMRDVGYDVNEALLTSDVPAQLVHDICKAVGVTCLDVVDEFRSDEAELYFPLDGHFNVAGQRKFGETLAPLIKSHFW